MHVEINMSDDRIALDLEKRRIIQDSLENLFHDVKIGGDFLTLFVFNNGKDSWQLQFNREFLDDLRTIRKLQLYMENTVIPAVLANPAMRIRIGSDGGITIAEKLS
ncbi:MAG: hypothetical protein H8K03_21135 [Nitrospira sp.]|jgi:hypothetical protein|nr:hypothetical protein [Nitrospira sp. BO4]